MDKLIGGMTEEEYYRHLTEELGMDDYRARFIIALEKGEIEGDHVYVDENGVLRNEGFLHFLANYVESRDRQEAERKAKEAQSKE